LSERGPGELRREMIDFCDAASNNLKRQFAFFAAVFMNDKLLTRKFLAIILYDVLGYRHANLHFTQLKSLSGESRESYCRECV